MTVKIPLPKRDEKEFKKVPPGAHFARCVQVIDLGDQASEWKGKPKVTRKVYLKFEIPDETVEWTDKDGKEHSGPMQIGATYTYSLGEKANLRRDLENWKGEAFTEEAIDNFDISSVIGKFCQVMVTHEKGANGKVYANVTGLMGLSKDQKPRAATYAGGAELIVYSPFAHDDATFQKLPEWLQKKIDERVKNAPEVPTDGAAVEYDDDIPF